MWLSISPPAVGSGCKQRSAPFDGAIGAATSPIKSTPSRMKAENAAKKLKFTAGTRYAAFEHVRVKYSYKVQ